MKIIKASPEHTLVVQRSRFIARLVPAESLDAVKQALGTQRRAHRKARHHCWACRLLDPNGRLVEQARDDGEVGRPGMVLLELLRREKIEGALIVSRLFGGVKLGPGGVSRAFRAVAEQALEKHLP